MATEGRPVTRVRASLTCVPCKRRKVKCEKQKPVCQQCRRTGVSCSYEAVPAGPESSYAEPPPKRRRTSHATQLGGDGTGNDRPGLFVSLGGPRQAQQPQNPVPSEADTSWASPHDEDIGTQFLPDDVDLSFLDDNDETSNCSANSLGEFFLPPDLITGGSAPLSETRDHFRAAAHPSASTNAVDNSNFELSISVGDHVGRHHVLTTKGVDCLGGQDLDFDRRASRPLRYIPDDRLTGSGLPTCLSDAPRHLRRYVDSPFWALAGNQKLRCTALLQGHIMQYHSQQFHERRWAELSRLLQALPSKKLCDVLLRSFLLGVRPILPLVHVPTLRTQYDSFWDRDFDRRSFAGSLKEDLSFACLLWSVLYCGAVAASPDLLAEAQFRVSDMSAFLSRLRSKLNETLEICCQDQLPTLNGLVASLLAEDCDPTVDQILDMPLFVSRSIQAARTMGLHREETLAAMGEVEGEIGRRVWHHIIHLDVFATIRSGTTISYSSSEESFNTLGPDEHGGQKSGRRFPYQGEPRASLSNIVATGKYELTRITRRILETCYGNSSSPPPQNHLEKTSTDIEQFEKRIDGLISMIEARGLPEHGQISSNLLSANPLTHGHLYLDDPHESAVFGAYCRIWLSMMKYSASVLFNRQFLHQTSLDQSSSLWSIEISNCIQFLRNYLDLARLPAFSPYKWFCPGKIDPLQECMIVLSFLKDCKGTAGVQVLQYLLSEILDIFRVSAAGNQGNQVLPPTNSLREASWRLVEELYVQIQSDRASKEALSLDTEPLSDHFETQTLPAPDHGSKGFTSWNISNRRDCVPSQTYYDTPDTVSSETLTSRYQSPHANNPVTTAPRLPGAESWPRSRYSGMVQRQQASPTMGLDRHESASETTQSFLVGGARGRGHTLDEFTPEASRAQTPRGSLCVERNKDVMPDDWLDVIST